MFKFITNLFKKKPSSMSDKEVARRVANLFTEVAFTREQLLEAMHTLRVHSNHSGVPVPNYGICHNVMYYLKTEHRVDPVGSTMIMCTLFQGWPDHSGMYAWPIVEDPSVTEWKGKNFVARQSLLAYAIARLERLNASQK